MGCSFYSVAARGEWVRNREKIAHQEYERLYAARFHAENYDPRSWCRLAKEAGMGYVVLTTRHHDGFCLWDSQTTTFTAARLGPQRDLLTPFVEACREFGLKVGFYYSVADWSHPDYPGVYARDWPEAWPDEAARQRFVAFYEAQLEELMTRYGQIDVLWYDGCMPQPLEGTRINDKVKQWQPAILINERNGGVFDFHCSEQAIKPAEGAWEACLTLNQNWGFHAGDHQWKNAKSVVRSLCECASSAGNLLLNVGPRADGTIPAESEAILKQVGAWLRCNGEFLSHSARQPFGWTNWGHFTLKGQTLYCHIFESSGEFLHLADLADEVQSVFVLATGKPIAFEQQGEYVKIGPLPPQDALVTTIAVEFAQPPQALTRRTSFWIPG